MKVVKPLVAFLPGLILVSVVMGLLFEVWGVNILYSSTLYLLLCVATAGHFIEETYTQAWKIEAQLRKDQDGNPKPPIMDRAFFVLFSHSLVIISFLFYFPIAIETFWALVYGLGVAILGMGNGIAHFAILIKFKVNTGCISGFFQFLFGLLIWVSLFIPLLP
ncbi:MAG: hypothetical protein ACFFDI_25520 [Promethearchaeota archaeon]